MKKLTLSVLLLLLILSGCATSEPNSFTSFSEDIRTQIQAEMDSLTSSEKPPGMVVWIDTPEHHFEGTSGYSNLVEKSSLAPQSPFRIGSITKMFTATIMMQLVEKGVLTLDDHLSEWLPDVANQLPYGEQITIRQLLTHTSGIYNIVENEAYYADLFSQVEVDEESGSASLDCVQHNPQETLMRYVYGKDAYFQPGKQWYYSNTNYLLAGMVIEKAMDIPLAEAFQVGIYEPLGMESTFLDCYENTRVEVVDGYMGFGGKLTNVTDLHESIGWAAGGLVSTAPDLLTFARGYFNGTLFENPESLTTMTTSSPGTSYGLGIFLHENSMGHTGGITGYRSLLQYIPELDTVVIILYNTDTADPEQVLADILTPALQELTLEK